MLFISSKHEKSHTQNVVEKLIRDPFLKNQHRAYLWIKNFTQFVFIICQVERYQNILKLSFRPLAVPPYKAISKTKMRSGASLPASFSALFLNKNICLAIFC